MTDSEEAAYRRGMERAAKIADVFAESSPVEDWIEDSECTTTMTLVLRQTYRQVAKGIAFGIRAIAQQERPK